MRKPMVTAAQPGLALACSTRSPRVGCDARPRPGTVVREAPGAGKWCLRRPKTGNGGPAEPGTGEGD